MSEGPKISQEKYAQAFRAALRNTLKKNGGDDTHDLGRDIASEQHNAYLQKIQEDHKKELELFETALEEADEKARSLAEKHREDRHFLIMAVKFIRETETVTPEKTSKFVKTATMALQIAADRRARSRDRSRGLEL